MRLAGPSRLDRFSIRRRAEALASADTRTLKRALYGETKTALSPTLCPDEGVARAHEKLSLDQRGEHLTAEQCIEGPQTGRLRQRQPQARHLPEIRLRSTNRCVE